MHDDDDDIEVVVRTVLEIVRRTAAICGYVFEFARDGSTIARGRPLLGDGVDERVAKDYFKPLGERAIKLNESEEDAAVAVGAPQDYGTDLQSWFGAFVRLPTKPAAAYVVIVYEFSTEPEAMRTFNFVQLVLARYGAGSSPSRSGRYEDD